MKRSAVPFQELAIVAIILGIVFGATAMLRFEPVRVATLALLIYGMIAAFIACTIKTIHDEGVAFAKKLRERRHAGTRTFTLHAGDTT